MDVGPINNVIFLADSYKISHHRQYPPGTTNVYSYFESRGGRFPYTVFFGLQYILKRWLSGPVLTKAMIQEAKELFAAHFNQDGVFNEEGWNYILERHGGKLPLRIQAIPEGSIIPTKNVLFTVESTDPAVPWITNFFETIFVQVWYPMTVATNSRIQKQIIQHYMKQTHDSVDTVSYQLHDFGYRGVSSVESAAIGGAAHLVNFRTTDTIAAVVLLKKYYHSPIAAFSVPASEHSTVTTWGREGEMAAFRNMMESFPNGTVACVSDSYDIWKCCEEIWGEKLKDMVKERGKNDGTLVIRPDSGDPPSVVLKCLEILGKAFGTEVNTKGYKCLPPYLKIIQGDGISYRTIGSILELLKANGWSAANVTFGSGGSLLQKVDRDTQKCAFKCSYALINGEGVDVYKDPITDPGKTSKRGRLALHYINGNYKTVSWDERDPEQARCVCEDLQHIATKVAFRCPYLNENDSPRPPGVPPLKLPISSSPCHTPVHKMNHVSPLLNVNDTMSLACKGENKKRNCPSNRKQNPIFPKRNNAIASIPSKKYDPTLSSWNTYASFENLGTSSELYTTSHFYTDNDFFQAGYQDLLVPVFENGELLKDYTLEEIRERAQLNENDIDVMKFLADEKN